MLQLSLKVEHLKPVNFIGIKFIAPANNPTKLGVSFLAVGPKTIYRNRKNSGNSTVKPEKNTLWARIKKLIGLK